MSESNGTTMNETPKDILAVAKPAPIVPKYFQIIPKDLTEAMKFAEMVAASDFVPKAYVGKAGNCLIAMQFGAELGLPPLQAIQNIAVINGKPGIYGDLGKALLYSKGFKIEERDAKETQAKNEAWCKVTRPNGEVTERTFSLEMSKTAKLWGKEGPWTNYPYRQMGWRAFWWAARDGAADVLKGIWGIEELQDYKRDAIETTTVDNAPKELPGKSIGAEAAEDVAALKTIEPTAANPVVDVPPPDGLSPVERKELNDLMKANGVTPEIMREYLKKKFGITVEKAPSAFIKKTDLGAVRAWVESPQDDLV
jgi:hypothetical protein